MDHQPRVELEKLLISLLTEADVRRIVRLLPGGEEMHAELPGIGVSLTALVHQAVSVLERHGRLDRTFFEALVAERPARRDEIRALAARMPGPAPAVPRSSDIIDFTGERARHQHFFGRQDILRELDDWLRSRDSGWLLLTGSPGLGKSAIFNHWLGVREQSGAPTAFHFIRRGIHNWADPSIVRASLAAMPIS